MSKQVLLLSVVFALFTNAFCQFYNFHSRLTGDQMIPPVNTARSAGLQVVFYPRGDPSAPDTDPVGLLVTYTLTTDINDITGLSIYGPAPSDTGPLIVEFTSSAKSGEKLVLVPGGATNYSTVAEYQKTLDSFFKTGYAYAILRTNTFPNGELRGEFDGVFSRTRQFYGGILFQFPATDAVSPIVFVRCDTDVGTAVATCSWNSAFPLGATIELQGPNGLLVPLRADSIIGPGVLPGVSGYGSFTVPAPLTLDQLLDFGNRGELRLSYKIGSTEIGSTALSISGKPATLEVNLNGANVVPPVTTSATGKVDLIIDPPTITLSHTVSNATRFSLNNGAVGANGAEAINFLPGLSPVPNDVHFPLDTYTILALYDFFSGFKPGYMTISSAANPQGEIRGQLALLPNNEFIDTLSGQKVVPPVTSLLTGQVVLRYDSILDALYFNISSTSTSTTAVLLRGPATSTSTGPILATLCSFKCNLRRIFFGVLKEDSGAFSSGQTLSSVLDVLLQGKAYVELQTTQNPAGELRANLPATVNNNPPFQVSDSAFSRPDIDIFNPFPPSVPSIPRFFRRRN